MPFSPRTWNFDIDRCLNRIIPASPLHRLPYPISHFLGYRKTSPEDVGNVLAAIFAFVGTFAGLLAVAGLFNYTSVKDLGGPVLIASFGASAILEYNALASPLAQPRNTLLGHILSAIIGVAVTKLFALSPSNHFHPPSKLSFVPASLAVAISSAAMLLTNTVHPPGGASAILAATLPEVVDMGWAFVGLVGLGSAIMLAVGLLTNNVCRRFPVYWWTPDQVGWGQKGEVKHEKKCDGDVERAEERFGGATVTIAHEKIHLPEWLMVSIEEMMILERLREKLIEAERRTSAQCIVVDSRDKMKEDEEKEKEVWRIV